MRAAPAETESREDLRPLWRRFRLTRDPELRDRLIRSSISLVRKVAGRLALRLPPHLDLDELEAAGVPGLLAAVESFDPDKDVDFAAYAQARIRGAILDELRNLDPLSRSLRAKARRIESAIGVLEQRLLRPPSDDEVAAHLGLPLDELHRVLQELRLGLHVSLDGGRGGEADAPGSGPPVLVESHAADPWEQLAAKERQALLGQLIDELPGSEGLVLSLYYVEELTMKEIGQVLAVSESRVSQIHNAALLRLRSRLRRRRLQAEDLRTEAREPHLAGMAHG